MKTSMPVFPKQLDDLLQKVGRSSQIYASELAKKMARRSLETIDELIRYKNQKIMNVNQGIEGLNQSVLALCKRCIKGPHIRLDIPTRLIRQVQRQTASNPRCCSEIIQGKAVFKEYTGASQLEVACAVASSNWHKLGEIKTETINIMEHLDKLLPLESKSYHKERIGLVTFQNGMANKQSSFIESAKSVFDHFKEAPLCIGLYNPTFFQSVPLPTDMARFPSEKTFNKSAVFSLCQMMRTLADLLPKINPNLFWAHFAHSEGGLIANAALEVCEDEWFFRDAQKYLKNNLITATYGAVKPIPNDYTKYSINTYSKHDIALFFGKDYIDLDLEEMIKSSKPVKKTYKGKTYTIKVIDSKVEFKEAIKMPVKMPERLSLKETLDLSFFEYVAYREEINAAPWGTQACINLVNDFAHRIKDHGFEEASYKEELKVNADDFKEEYKI